MTKQKKKIIKIKRKFEKKKCDASTTRDGHDGEQEGREERTEQVDERDTRNGEREAPFSCFASGIRLRRWSKVYGAPRESDGFGVCSSIV